MWILQGFVLCKDDINWLNIRSQQTLSRFLWPRIKFCFQPLPIIQFLHPTPTGRQATAPLSQPGHRKVDQQASYLQPSPRVQRHPRRKDMPRETYTVASFKTKPNPNRFWFPGVNPTFRQCGQDNTATGYKDWEQQPARITKLLTMEDGKVYGESSSSGKRTWKGGATRTQLRVCFKPRSRMRFPQWLNMRSNNFFLFLLPFAILITFFFFF